MKTHFLKTQAAAFLMLAGLTPTMFCGCSEAPPTDEEVTAEVNEIEKTYDDASSQVAEKYKNNPSRRSGS